MNSDKKYLPWPKHVNEIAKMETKNLKIIIPTRFLFLKLINQLIFQFKNILHKTTTLLQHILEE